ncbi:MAG: VOC family protein [Xanthobacteraceae bacterium]|jgi:hypothetical protein
MSRQPSDLAATVKAMRPFVPAKDFAISKQFYADLGFRVEPLGDALAAMHLGPHSFLLQDFHVEAWADNFMMHMMVDDLDAWWEHVAALNLASRFGVKSPRAPKLESWGLNVAYLFDPAGVLWHIAAEPAQSGT